MRPELRLAILAGAMVAACGPESSADAGTAGETASTDDPTTGDTPTTGATEAPWEQVPECDGLALPGDAADLAATPRPDRDAEVLALSLDPTVVVVPQARYELVVADLAAIRAIDPPLADVHVGRDHSDALELWFLDGSRPAWDSIWGFSYRAWDCLNAHYRGDYPYPIDGFGFLLEFDGIHGEAVRDLYAALPGLEEADISRSSTCYRKGCEFAGSIALTPTLDAGGDPIAREYRFESKDEVVRTYRVVDGETPVLVD